jgi:cation:H+ antiporter|tara:strand:+ start:2981 stop:4042 length:1062 start_codon:yes stop_codon:yes gene_type:complete
VLTTAAAHYTIPALLNKPTRAVIGDSMSALYLPMFALVAGILGLLWGADRFVAGSAGAARNFGISPMVIGLTLVSVGTSAPEIIVSINAALSNVPQMAVGNALGSNLANIGLVLGITALVAPLPVQKHLLREESPTLLLITALAGLCLYDGFLHRGESIALALLTIPLLIVIVKYKKNHPNPEAVEEAEEIPVLPMAKAGLLFVVGLVVLLVSARVTVWGAQSIAVYAGISELIIGLTVVAIGTSLPELAASVMSALKGHHDIALGNVFGSNLFNLMLVMTSAGAIAPMALDQEVFARDFAAMAFMTVLMIALVALALRKSPQKARLSRGLGLVLLAGYGFYYVLLWPAITAV